MKNGIIFQLVSIIHQNAVFVKWAASNW